MKALIVALLLAGCATQPVAPPDTESAPAVGSVSFWRWMGRAIMAVINVTDIKVELKAEKKDD